MMYCIIFFSNAHKTSQPKNKGKLFPSCLFFVPVLVVGGEGAQALEFATKHHHHYFGATTPRDKSPMLKRTEIGQKGWRIGEGGWGVGALGRQTYLLGYFGRLASLGTTRAIGLLHFF